MDKFRLLWEKMEPFLRLRATSEYRIARVDRLQSFFLNLGKPNAGTLLLEPSAYKAVSSVLEQKKKPAE